MRPGPAATVGLLLSLALILPGCGDEQTTAAGTESASSEAARSEAKVTTAGEGSGDPAAARRCRRALGGFLDSMESLNNTLAVGLSYDDYLGAVNDVRSTYAGVEADRLPIVCLGNVAGPAERALNVYIEAVNTWGNCLATASCDPESIESELQREWERASDLIASAQRGMRSQACRRRGPARC
jgi:hypothetical protein